MVGSVVSDWILVYVGVAVSPSLHGSGEEMRHPITKLEGEGAHLARSCLEQ